jgi:hypothetical protein
MEVPPQYLEPDVAARIRLISESFARLLGRPLVEQADSVAGLWDHPNPVVAHGTEADPLFFFANRAALAAFEATLDEFLGMPSRYSAEAPLREERERFMAQVRSHGFVKDYRGVRISRKGNRFVIAQGIVWNLLDPEGTIHGQAATFVPQAVAIN